MQQNCINYGKSGKMLNSFERGARSGGRAASGMAARLQLLRRVAWLLFMEKVAGVRRWLFCQCTSLRGAFRLGLRTSQPITFIYIAIHGKKMSPSMVFPLAARRVACRAWCGRYSFYFPIRRKYRFSHGVQKRVYA